MCVPLPLVSAFWTVLTVILDKLNEKIYNKITTDRQRTLYLPGNRFLQSLEFPL